MFGHLSEKRIRSASTQYRAQTFNVVGLILMRPRQEGVDNKSQDSVIHLLSALSTDPT